MKSMKLQTESHSEMARSPTTSSQQAFICLHLCTRSRADKLLHHGLIYVCAQDLSVISTFSWRVPCRMTNIREVGQGVTDKTWRKPCPAKHPCSWGARCVYSRDPGCRAGGPHTSEPPQWGDSRSCSHGIMQICVKRDHVKVQGCSQKPMTHSWVADRILLVKNLPAMQDTLVRFLGQEDPLEKG